jgi:nitrate/TMAO reductase-like tetraheme cytochrome c subunit
VKKRIVKKLKAPWRLFLQLKLWVQLAIVGGVLGSAFMVTAIEVTGTTRFCNSCHIMNDYYASWQHSDHNEVNCLLCHLQPGFAGYVKGKINGLAQAVDCMVGRVGTKPNGKVMDSSCLRGGCHTIDELRDDVIDFNGIKFTHNNHITKTVDGIPLECGICHSHFEGQEHFNVNKDVCYTCHFLEDPHGGGRLADTQCQSCHEVPDRTIQRGLVTINHAEFVSYSASCEESCHKNEIRQPSRVADNVCLNCHSERLAYPVDSNEIHAQHMVGHRKVECFVCHGEVLHAQRGIQSVTAMMDCQSCHSDTHQIQQTIYSTAHPTQTEAADRVLSPMFLTHVECTGCHIERTARQSGALDSFGTVARAIPEACDACHEPGTGAQYIPFWQKQIKELHAQITEQLGQREREIRRRNAGQENPQVQAVLRDVRAILDSITADGSWGVHNFKYTESVLQEARKKLASLRDGAA